MSGLAFREALLDPSRPVPDGVIDPQGRPSARRFAVYRNNVTVGLAAALEVGFPVVRKLVGAEFFAAMAREHLREHPPASPVMSLYGAMFPEFLECFPPVASLPYLPDVARLELALRESYHAADAPPITPEALSQVTPEALSQVRLLLAPSLRLLRSAHPIHSIWCANTDDAAIRPVPGAQDVLVLRPGYDPAPHLLAPAAARFIEAVLAGGRIGEAAEGAGEELDLATVLSLLLSGGGLVGLEASE